MMLDNLYTFAAFILALILTPAFLISYVVVRLCHTAWLYFLTTIHPDVDFIRETTVRTLVDTRRNQGIFTVLLRVEGEPRVDLVQQHLLEVVSRVDKWGNVRFPKLSMVLVSHWGSYAWKRTAWKKENVVGQVLVVGAKATHRGRPLTEVNVKEHVSDIITRYLPRGVPPWQLVILPCSGSESHYLLLRMHHLLLTDGDINIADLLPLATSSEPIMSSETLRHYVDSPLIHVLEGPDHIRCLYESLIENLNNRWNEFTSNYDPLNKPELLKSPQGLLGFNATLLVAFVGILRKIWYGYDKVNSDAYYKFKYIKSCIKNELSIRGIYFTSIFDSILVSINPKIIILSYFKLTYNIIALSWRTPIFIYNESKSLIFHIFGISSCNLYSSTTVDTICHSVPLVLKATGQVLRWCNAIYHSPRLFLDEMIISRGWPGGVQIPLCGRKVVSWSKPISGEKLREISQKTGLSCTEILLTCLGGTLSDYYKSSCTPIPNSIPITARRISSEYLFSSGPNVRPQDALSGLLCLRVPIINLQDSYRRSLSVVADSIATARQHQACVYLMSVLQTKNRIMTRALPSVLVAILFRYLSKKYTVAMTELIAGDENGQIRYTTWGRKISDIIYWRPPQANISMSLCLNYYEDKVTLAVMSDAMLSPHHIPLAEGFPNHLETLAKDIES